MEIDKTTLHDLSIFAGEESFTVFDKLNLCETIRGEERMMKNLATPLATKAQILEVQETLKFISTTIDTWPTRISNGTLMVVEQFFQSRIDPIPAAPTHMSTATYKLLHGHDYSLIKYSIGHLFDFIKGLQQLVETHFSDTTPKLIADLLLEIQKLITRQELAIISKYDQASKMPKHQMMRLARFFMHQFKFNTHELLVHYAQLDAWRGMAKAMLKYNLVNPEFVDGDQPVIEAKGLYHLLLQEPVPYDVLLNKETNFIFLTGANMAGKSTFIKAVGLAVFLAHTGMGVPATSLRLSVFDGLLSNINVIDNIARGESYFYNEVQRIKNTVLKINDGRKWLILIDELFKGTNVEDAMKCSTAVIEGLIKIKNSLFILSTHLYEIGHDLKKYPNIQFNYFETSVNNDELTFNYQLASGISDDRLGYLILRREGVVGLLEGL